MEVTKRYNCEICQEPCSGSYCSQTCAELAVAAGHHCGWCQRPMTVPLSYCSARCRAYWVAFNEGGGRWDD